jgi:hypothetical protein
VPLEVGHEKLKIHGWIDAEVGKIQHYDCSIVGKNDRDVELLVASCINRFSCNTLILMVINLDF